MKVAAERPGRLVTVRVQEGQPVRKGELLAEIESDELSAGLDEARARVQEAAADVRLAEVNLERRRRLLAERIVAAHDLDQATRDLEIARARHETARATVASDEAQLRKSRIVAPISGTVTAREVDAGEMLESGLGCCRRLHGTRCGRTYRRAAWPGPDRRQSSTSKPVTRPPLTASVGA